MGVKGTVGNARAPVELYVARKNRTNQMPTAARPSSGEEMPQQEPARPTNTLSVVQNHNVTNQTTTLNQPTGNMCVQCACSACAGMQCRHGGTVHRREVGEVGGKGEVWGGKGIGGVQVWGGVGVVVVVGGR